MKKQFTSLIAASLALLLAACGSSAPSDTASTAATSTAESVAASASEEAPAEESAPAFEAQTILDNEYCTMTLESIDENAMWGYTWKVYLENKTDKNLTFGMEDCSVNGVMADPFWAATVAAGKKSNENISWSSSLFEESGISADQVTQVSFELRVYDSDDWSAGNLVEDTFTVYPMGEENASTVERTAQDTDIVLIDNDECSLIVTGFDPDNLFGYAVNVYLVNKTDKDLMFSVNDASINGFMCDPFWATSVAAGKTKNSSISWTSSALEENGIETVEEIELPIRVYYDDDWTGNDLVNDVYTVTPQ